MHTRANHRAWATAKWWICGLLLSVASVGFAAPPTAVDDQRIIPPDSSLTLNVLANDFDPDGDAITLVDFAQPANGTVELVQAEGTFVYTPAPGFSGSDSFTYAIQESAPEALTATATVTIEVRASEYLPYAETANSQSLASTLERACDNVRSLTDAQLGTGGRLLRQRCQELESLAATNPEAMEDVLRQISPEEIFAQAQAADQSQRARTQAIASRIETRHLARHALLINGQRVAAAGTRGGSAGDESERGLLARMSVFGSFQFEDSDRAYTEFENGYEASQNSLTLGGDYFMSTAWFIGLAYSYALQDLEYLAGSGELETETATLTAYSSWQFGDFTADLQVGIGGSSYDTHRLIAYSGEDFALDQTLTGATKSTQYQLNGQLQWRWTHNAFSLFPFARCDWQNTSIEAFGERGNSGLEMQMTEQTLDQITLSLGVQATRPFNFSWGVLVPTVTTTLLSDSLAKRNDVAGRFTFDPEQANYYGLTGNDVEASYYEIGIGSTAVFKHGLTAFFEYRTRAGFQYLDLDQVKLGLRYEL